MYTHIYIYIYIYIYESIHILVNLCVSMHRAQWNRVKLCRVQCHRE